MRTLINVSAIVCLLFANALSAAESRSPNRIHRTNHLTRLTLKERARFATKAPVKLASMPVKFIAYQEQNNGAEAETAIELYPCVKYKDCHNAHPCGVTEIVKIVDPCYDPCSCCEPSCVYVAICVPPCGCRRIKVRDHGRKITYDYGKYEVEIKSKRGVVVVDYDD
jgi:hypothetical protein